VEPDYGYQVMTYKFRDLRASHPHLQFVTVGYLTPETLKDPTASQANSKTIHRSYVETEYEVEPLTATKVHQDPPDPQERQKVESNSLAALRRFLLGQKQV
jgi:hypothetical protein